MALTWKRDFRNASKKVAEVKLRINDVCLLKQTTGRGQLHILLRPQRMDYERQW